MDPASYKDIITSRDLTYHYFFSSPSQSKPTLLLLHGFPSTSYDWHHQISFFQEQGYGLIVPDMLGYGGTSKPLDPELYKSSLICKDLIDILDAEKARHVIAIGHDWGSRIASRLASYYPDRFEAFAFLAVSYLPPRPKFDIPEALALTKKVFGYELFGYWLFFSEDGAEKIAFDHWDSFTSIIWSDDPTLWKTDLAPVGALKSRLTSGKTTPLPSWLTPEDRKIQFDTLRKNGLAAPFCWYKILTSGIEAEDDSSIPADRYAVHKPVFFGGAKEDYVALSARGSATVAEYCKNATVREFNTGHWVILQAPQEVNKELLSWIESVKNKL